MNKYGGMLYYDPDKKMITTNYYKKQAKLMNDMLLSYYLEDEFMNTKEIDESKDKYKMDTFDWYRGKPNYTENVHKITFMDACENKIKSLNTIESLNNYKKFLESVIIERRKATKRTTKDKETHNLYNITLKTALESCINLIDIKINTLIQKKQFKLNPKATPFKPTKTVIHNYNSQDSQQQPWW